MLPNNLGLLPGDLVEISYPSGRISAGAQLPSKRWLRARVIDCTPDAWPLVRLQDGQTTEIRKFMRWRLVARAVQEQSDCEAA